jgi:TATA-box binding protein (TBP) (component of TFIID and TFIIIB)
VTLHFAEDGPMAHSTVKIFEAGKLLCPGCATCDAALFALYTVVALIRRVCPDVRAGVSYNSNVVGSMSMHLRIDLALLHRYIDVAHASAGCRSTYDGDFSGIRFRDYDADIAYLIFCTGNIIITSGKQSADITTAARKLYQTFARCHEINRAIFSVASGRSKKSVPLPPGFFRQEAEPDPSGRPPPRKRTTPDSAVKTGQRKTTHTAKRVENEMSQLETMEPSPPSS